jgi:hypothetical protein
VRLYGTGAKNNQQIRNAGNHQENGQNRNGQNHNQYQIQKI